MQSKNLKYRLFPIVVYPITLMVGVGLFFYLKALSFDILIATYAPVAFGAASITFFELFIPHQKKWIPGKSDVWNDTLFLVTVQMILPKVLTFLVAIGLLRLMGHYGLQAESLWPHHWNIGLQTILMVLIADFFRYWLHKFSHENATLWKLHAVHHSPKKLYWLNVGRFHPIEKALQFLFDAMPFILVGISEEVLALYFIFYGINGFFQHCNIELRMGVLNYVISGPQLHRWHHSRKIQESNTNYGNNIIIWDLVFGTYFFPKDRLVNELGLVNTSYPLDYSSQLATPFSGRIDKERLPLQSLQGMLLNKLLKFKMQLIKHKLYKPLLAAAAHPADTQKETLLAIISANENTEFGKQNGFTEITDYDSYKKAVPIQDYEKLRPYIEKQENEKSPVLTSELPFMYNQTSGTTGKPKYIPILEKSLESLKKSQQVFSYIQYKAFPEAFYGKIMGIVSPAVEGHLETGTAYGSASGHIYKTMPWLARLKYVLPKEIFEIEDHEIKYYVVCRLAMEQKDITYLGSANPSTFGKLLDLINENLKNIIEDIENGTCRFLDNTDDKIQRAISRKLRPNKKRAAELSAICDGGKVVSYEDMWPYLKLLVTWTGGSCGISLNKILSKLPKDIKVIDLGYLASELRGTITIDTNTNEGLPTLHENFFEFVEKDNWEYQKPVFRTLEQLELGKEYYIFITTPTGLYRYDMNDIIVVTGKFGNTPTLKFQQKGKGVTNITGEKLYESQIITVMNKAELELGATFSFYQVLANEGDACYEFYIEAGCDNFSEWSQLASYLDTALQKENIEYLNKRSSERLKELKVNRIKEGTFELYKNHYLELGQREGQFKPQILQNKKEFSFNLSEHCINEN